MTLKVKSVQVVRFRDCKTILRKMYYSLACTIFFVLLLFKYIFHTQLSKH